jgi:hypothetical protein
MVKLNELQWSILEKLIQERENPELNIENSAFHLKENDPMMKIREMVFHIDFLIEQGFLVTHEAFYEASDKMSFEYMNSAVSIDLSKVIVTPLGQSLVADKLAQAELTLMRRGLGFIKNLFDFSVSQWVLILAIGIFCFYLGFRLT